MINSELEGTTLSRYYVPRSNKALKRPKISKINKLNRLIENADKVYVTGDWHLWGADKEGIFRKGKRYEKTIEEIKKLQPNDFLIFMGDLVDDEFEDKVALEKVLKLIKCKSVMILGNNDLFDMEYYNKNFDFVVEGFQYKDLIFTHFPFPGLINDFNIHGHIHDSNTYWEHCPRNFNAFDMEGKFFELDSILDYLHRGFTNPYGKFVSRESKDR